VEISSIALGGLQQTSANFDQAAAHLTAAASTAAGDSVDLSIAAVDMLAARNQFTASLKVVQIADRMQRNTLDLLA
jgi:flagellar hook protein FlgE